MKEVQVRIAKKPFRLQPSDPGGHFFGSIRLDCDTIDEYKSVNRLPIEVVTSPSDSRNFRGVAHLIPPEGISVISDIDDTIKVSDVTNKKELVQNTFVRPFRGGGNGRHVSSLGR